MLRTFAAVQLEAAVKAKAAKLTAKLQATGANMKWVEAENLHVTLFFLGDVEEQEITPIYKQLAAALAGYPPFSVEVQNLGGFPGSDSPRVVWLGIEQGKEELCRLQQTVSDALDALGFPPEARKFQPHLTLGRIRRGRGAGPGQLTDALRENADYSAGGSEISEVVLFSSELTKEGPIYTPLATILLEASSS